MLHSGLRTWTVHALASSSPHRRPPQRIAIIGGGLAGLACAEQLVEATRGTDAVSVTLLDTGRLRPGGRCASRIPHDAPSHKETSTPRSYPILSQYRVDHAAQMVVVDQEQGHPTGSSSPSGSGTTCDPYYQAFRHQVEQWVEQGVLQEFPHGSLAVINNSPSNTVPCVSAVSSANQRFYYAPQSVASIPLAMLQSVTRITGNDPNRFSLRQDVWVSPSHGLQYLPETQEWQVSSSNTVVGRFDAVIIAHNGKCADRLTKSTPARLINRLLQVSFQPKAPRTAQRMILNSIYSLTIVLPANSVLSQAMNPTDTTNSRFFCGIVQGHPDLSLVTCQTNKLVQPEEASHEVWTILSSAAFAAQHKAPQEFLPDAVVETVSRRLLQSLGECLCQSEHAVSSLTMSVLEQRLQLWGAGLPLNSYYPDNNKEEEDHSDSHMGKSLSREQRDGYLWDDKYRIGVCGDWLLESSLQGAWTSGHRLGRFLAQGGRRKRFGTKALRGSFRASEAVARVGIGAMAFTQDQDPPDAQVPNERQDTLRTVN